MKRGFKRTLIASLALSMTLSMCACGGKTEGENNSDGSNTSVEKLATSYETAEFLYVPEYFTMGEDANFYNAKILGDTVYYPSFSWDEETYETSVCIMAFSLTDKSSVTIPVELGEDEYFNTFDIDEEGNLYLISEIYQFDEATYESDEQYFFVKKDKDGNDLIHKEITDNLRKDDISYLQNIVCDDKGQSYVRTESSICLIDAEGNYCGLVNFNGQNPDWIDGMCKGTDGRVYIGYNSYNAEISKRYFVPIEFEKKTVGESIDFPSVYNSKIVAGTDGTYYYSDGTALNKFNPATGEKEQILTWSDSDIVGDYVEAYAVCENGDVIALVSDWENDSNDAVILKKTEAAKVQKKINLTLLTLYDDSTVTRQCIQFNKLSDKYHVSVVSFIDVNDEWTDNTFIDGMNAMNNYLISGKSADIINLEYGKVSTLAAKGVFEDLTPFLEQSSQLNREDFLENILEDYTYDGKLIGIPRTFYIEVIVGAGKDLGNRTGWTIDEMMAYCDQYPKAKIFEYGTKESTLETLMAYSGTSFVDWDNGKANFNNDEFKKILQFSNRFLTEKEMNEAYDNESSAPSLIQRGELLFDRAYISSFEDIQVYYEIFEGNPAFIGYPTSDGRPGISVNAYGTFAISSKSENIEGAWDFVECALQTNQGNLDWGFSTNKKILEKQRKNATKVEYVLDENGDPYLDEDGNPVINGGGGGFSYIDGWSFTYHVTTEEEANQVMELLELSTQTVELDEDIYKIITEEAGSYFSGQKSVDEVVEVIQRRVQLFMDEKM